jgi:hypothetical protein
MRYTGLKLTLWKWISFQKLIVARLVNACSPFTKQGTSVIAIKLYPEPPYNSTDSYILYH